MAIFQDYAGANTWRKQVAESIRASTPGWDEMNGAQRKEAAKAWYLNLSPEVQADMTVHAREYKSLKAQSQPPSAPAPRPPAPQPQQQSQTTPPQPQAGIRPPQQPTAFQFPSSEGEAADYYGAKGYKGQYIQNNQGKWIPGDAEWRHTHTPDGNRRPGIRPGIYGSSVAEIGEHNAAARLTAGRQNVATTARWQAAENAAAARQRDPSQPYVAGGSFSNDGRTNGEVYDMWRKRGSVGGLRRTL